MRYILSALILCLPFFAGAQFNLKKLGDKVQQKVNQRVDNKTDKAIDKGLDKAESGAKKTGSDESGEEGKSNEGTSEPKATKGAASAGLKSYSKFDFVPAQKIVYAEDFSQDVIGEFPLKWNTDGSGEIVTVDKAPGKWLDLIAGTRYETPYNKKFPANYTIEFDLLVQMAYSVRVPELTFMIDQEGGNKNYPIVALALFPAGGTNSEETPDRTRFTSYQNNGTVFLQGKDQLLNEFSKFNGKLTPVHVAMWVQGQRFRAWVNGLKIYDLPKGISADTPMDRIAFVMGSYGSEKSNYQYYLSNIRVGEALPDTRSKLITEGKWSTNGILFDVNSDKIKPSSYGVLKEIAAMLNENPGVKVKIIGHTDSDGEDARNLDLSKRRAAAVKTALANEFNIDAASMETDGMGETKPVGDNKTPESKALNRRVEFIKL